MRDNIDTDDTTREKMMKSARSLRLVMGRTRSVRLLFTVNMREEFIGKVGG
jgi:hypothetical protein